MSFLFFMLIGYLATVAIAANVIKHLPMSKSEPVGWLLINALAWPVALGLWMLKLAVLEPLHGWFQGD